MIITEIDEMCARLSEMEHNWPVITAAIWVTMLLVSTGEY